VINPRAFIQRKDEFKKTVLKRGCSIGANATIVCGVTIGEYALVGSGAVVHRDVKPHALLVHTAKYAGVSIDNTMHKRIVNKSILLSAWGQVLGGVLLGGGVILWWFRKNRNSKIEK
jgi:acyl-[acyl carrier protein]--UDP-N-acetylglucosamine O-acyltransferase